jgi:RNA:NAD 2'-phosphotransferase (TPT1/KptA family)
MFRFPRAAGIQFYRGNAHVWLADEVPASFVTRPD